MGKRIWLLWFAALTATAFAQGNGAIPVRIPDGPHSRCINGASDRVWLTMRRVITDKNGGWLTKDTTISVIATVLVHSDPEAAKPLSFPLTTEATLESYGTGQVSVPIEYSMVDGFNLSQPNGQSSVKYTGFQVDLTLLNMKGKTKWGSGLQALDTVAKKLPLPASPITSTATYLLDFANNAVTSDLNAQDTSDKVKAATITLNFDPTGSCQSEDFESTGTIAIVQGGPPKDGYFVDISRPDDYCFSADLRPAFVLKAAGKDPSKACTAANYTPQWNQVSNDYVAFFLNAVASPGHLGGHPTTDKADSLARCRANGIADQDCLK